MSSKCIRSSRENVVLLCHLRWRRYLLNYWDVAVSIVAIATPGFKKRIQCDFIIHWHTRTSHMTGGKGKIDMLVSIGPQVFVSRFHMCCSRAFRLAKVRIHDGCKKQFHLKKYRILLSCWYAPLEKSKSFDTLIGFTLWFRKMFKTVKARRHELPISNSLVMLKCRTQSTGNESVLSVDMFQY